MNLLKSALIFSCSINLKCKLLNKRMMSSHPQQPVLFRILLSPENQFIVTWWWLNQKMVWDKEGELFGEEKERKFREKGKSESNLSVWKEENFWLKSVFDMKIFCGIVFFLLMMFFAVKLFFMVFIKKHQQISCKNRPINQLQRLISKCCHRERVLTSRRLEWCSVFSHKFLNCSSW